MKHFSLFAFICLLSAPALAENSTHELDDGGIIPNKTHEVPVATDALSLHIAMDKSELVRLEEPAGSIIVGNPVHASVLMDSPTRLVVVPRAPGATHFTVLNKSGDVLLQRHVIVAAPKESYIRVRKATCGADADECIETETFFCEGEGMCHEIVSAAAEEQKAAKDDASDAPQALDADSLADLMGGEVPQ